MPAEASMLDRTLRAIRLLGRLHSATGGSPARRLAALEHLLEPLGDLLGATAVILLTRDGDAPLLVRNPSGHDQRTAACARANASGGNAGAWAGTWWVRWMEPFAALPADGCVRRGLLLPRGPRVVASPAGWGATRAPRAARARQGARPVLAQGFLLGRHPVRVILLREPGQAPFTEEDTHVLAALADHLQVQHGHARLIERLRRATLTDDLTRIYNYRYLKRSLHASLQTLRRRGGTFSVLMVDVDNLREYNNRFGHLAASKVLAEIGEVLRRGVGRRGWVAKYGGDEFLIVLPRLGGSQAHGVAERLRAVVDAAHIGTPPFGGITCSFGVASAPRDGDAYVPLLEAADRALFEAKARGRNTVVDASGQEEPREGDLAA
jgi:two-component system cell cycle response regulator